MGTWLTYSAALLMAGATAFTFSSSSSLYGMMNSITSYLTGAAAILFLIISFVTVAAGTASLRKNRKGGKVVVTTILWALCTTLVLSFFGALVSKLFTVIFPVSASAGGEYTSLIASFSSFSDPLSSSTLLSKFFIPVFFIAFLFGIALTPSSDVIRPAYTVMNSFSEVLYRVQRTITYFGACYVYIAGTTFFLGLWQEKTFFAASEPFFALLSSTALVVLIVLPLLYAVFTGFRKNPYAVIGRGLSGLITAFVSGNIFASSLLAESLSRSNLGIQKRISSTVTPLSILISRGGTAFVSIVTLMTLLKTLGADISTPALVIITLTVALFSFASSLFAGIEVAAISVLTLKALNIDVYGAEAAIVSIIPFVNGCALLIDMVISLMASALSGAVTKTDAKIPLKDTI